MSEPKQLVPRLRFPEFRGAKAWKAQAGSDLFDQVNERNAQADLPVLAITQEHGAIPRELIDYHVSVTEKSLESYKVVQPGDFIISLRSFQGGIEHSHYRGVCSPAYVVLRRRGEGSDEYFKHYLKTDGFIQVLTKNLEGLRDGKMISYKQFSELRLPVPAEAEQQKIADCLSSLDELIAAQGRKVAALKAHRKGMMQALFPRESEAQPYLRFPEFYASASWAETTLGEIVQIMSGESPSQYDLRQVGAFPFVKVEDLNNCERYQSEAREYTNDLHGIVPSGSVIFPKRGASIALNKIRLSARDIAMDTNMMALTPNDSCQAQFLFYCLSLIGLDRIADASTIPQINNKHIIPFSVLLPLMPEQQRITECLTAVDELITAATQELEALKTHKQALMQQLFPSAEALEA